MTSLRATEVTVKVICGGKTENKCTDKKCHQLATNEAKRGEINIQIMHQACFLPIYFFLLHSKTLWPPVAVMWNIHVISYLTFFHANVAWMVSGLHLPIVSFIADLWFAIVRVSRATRTYSSNWIGTQPVLSLRTACWLIWIGKLPSLVI